MNHNPIVQQVAARALIFFNNKLLIIRENQQYNEATNIGSYDLIGGRITPGESIFESLKREAKEETGLEITIGQPFAVEEWRPTIKDQPYQIVGIAFICTSNTDQIALSPDHDDYQWITLSEVDKYPIIPPQLSLIKKYIKIFGYN